MKKCSNPKYHMLPSVTIVFSWVRSSNICAQDPKTGVWRCSSVIKYDQERCAHYASSRNSGTRASHYRQRRSKNTLCYSDESTQKIGYVLVLKARKLVLCYTRYVRASAENERTKHEKGSVNDVRITAGHSNGTRR